MSCIGIDFGTKNSAVCVERGKDPRGNIIVEPVVRPHDGNTKHFSSYIAYDHDGNVSDIGEDAENFAEENPAYTIYDIKRLIGRRYDEEEFQSYKPFLTYHVGEDANGQIIIKIGGKSLSPEDVAADLMEKMLERTFTKFRDLTLDRLGVTVPAYFDPIKREKTKKAAMLAVEKLKTGAFRDRVKIPDFDNKNPADVLEIQLVTEPTAALLTYLAKRKIVIPLDKYVMLFDLGAGTLDITIGQIGTSRNAFTGEVKDDLTIKSIHGNNDLGGRRMDEGIYAKVASRLEQEKHISPNEFRHVLKKEVELAKIRLSKLSRTNINLFDQKIELPIQSKSHVDYHPEPGIIILEDCITEILNDIRKEIREALKKAGISRDQLGAVILVGGPSNMPSVRQIVSEETIPFENIPGWDPLICVAEGAVRYGGDVDEPSAFNYFIAVELIEGVRIPTNIVQPTDKLPINSTSTVLIRRYDSDSVYHNHFYLLTEKNGVYSAFNKITIPAAAGNGTINFSVPYSFNKIKHVQTKNQLPFSFGPFEIRYQVTSEGLFKRPEFFDPLTQTVISFPDIPHMEYGEVKVTEKTLFDRNKETYAKKELDTRHNKMDEDINEIMRTEGLSRRQAEEKYFSPPLPFEVLVLFSRAAIRIAEERRMPGDLINTWQRVHGSATTESQASKVKLHGIISAVKTGSGLDEGAFNTRLSEIANQLAN